jgi:molybdate transport system permease protein
MRGAITLGYDAHVKKAVSTVPAREPTRAARSGRIPVLPMLLAGVLIVFLLLPTLVILARGAQSGLAGALSSPTVLAALRVSAVTTGITIVITIILGTPVAYLLARHEFPGKRVLDALLDLPIVLPPVVAGLGLLLTFGRNGLLGPGIQLANLEIAFSPAAVVMAQTFVAAPYFVRAARAGFQGVDIDLIRAALVDGASRLQAFRLVTWPLAWPALLEGIVLAWARALGEFGATILFAGSLEGRTRTMTLAVYGALESDVDAALVLSGLMALIAFVILFGFRVWGSRR